MKVLVILMVIAAASTAVSVAEECLYKNTNIYVSKATTVKKVDSYEDCAEKCKLLGSCDVWKYVSSKSSYTGEAQYCYMGKDNGRKRRTANGVYSGFKVCQPKAAPATTPAAPATTPAAPATTPAAPATTPAAPATTPAAPATIPAAPATTTKPGKPLRNRCRASSECGGANTECKTYRCKCKEDEGFYKQNGQCLAIKELFPGTRCDKKGRKGKNQEERCAGLNNWCRGYGCLCDKGYKVTADKRGCIKRVSG